MTRQRESRTKHELEKDMRGRREDRKKDPRKERKKDGGRNMSRGEGGRRNGKPVGRAKRANMRGGRIGSEQGRKKEVIINIIVQYKRARKMKERTGTRKER